MVNNFDRIYKEIQKEAEKIATENAMDTEALVELAMAIVNLEDEHKISRININQEIEALIQKSAIDQIKKEGN